MGDPDLSGGGSQGAGPAPASLADLIRAGDADAFAGFRDAHIGMVRAYCEVACAPALVTQACESAFLDFVGRIGGTDLSYEGLEAMLLAATRSAAASRFPPPPTPSAAELPEPGAHRGRRHAAAAPQPRVCAAMPELLAARANGELRGDDRGLTHHLAGCPLCAATEARLQAAEAAFTAASGSPAVDAQN